MKLSGKRGKMKLKLLNEEVHEIERAEVVDGRLEVDIKGKTAEEVQQIFSQPSNLDTIELLTDAKDVFSILTGWTKYGGVMLNGDLKTAILTQPADKTEKRLTSAEADAEQARKIAEEQADDIAEIKKLAEEGGMGVDAELFAATTAVARVSAQGLTDVQALEAKVLYPTFEELAKKNYIAKKKGYIFRDGEDLWKTAQDNVKFEEQYKPGTGTESLYTHIDEAHAGTIEDPIPAKVNMEYEYGKYYSEDGTIYLCKRGGIPDDQAEEMYGEKETLQYLPSALVGQYFIVAKTVE